LNIAGREETQTFSILYAAMQYHCEFEWGWEHEMAISLKMLFWRSFRGNEDNCNVSIRIVNGRYGTWSIFLANTGQVR
jgi:hypothetical protein